MGSIGTSVHTSNRTQHENVWRLLCDHAYNKLTDGWMRCTHSTEHLMRHTRTPSTRRILRAIAMTEGTGETAVTTRSPTTSEPVGPRPMPTASQSAGHHRTVRRPLSDGWHGSHNKQYAAQDMHGCTHTSRQQYTLHTRTPFTNLTLSQPPSYAPSLPLHLQLPSSSPVSCLAWPCPSPALRLH